MEGVLHTRAVKALVWSYLMDEENKIEEKHKSPDFMGVV